MRNVVNAFQFLLGRLKTLDASKSYSPDNEFQFLLGRLKTKRLKNCSWFLSPIHLSKIHLNNPGKIRQNAP